MSQVDVQITNRLGLHARAAARFVHLAGTFRSQILVGRSGARVNGKSILGLLTLAAAKGTKLSLFAEGDDADEALTKLSELIHDRFGEDE